MILIFCTINKRTMKKTLFLLLFLLLPLVAAAQANEVTVPAEVAPFINANQIAIALETADLNGDGRKDFVLVAETPKDSDSNNYDNNRSLKILVRGADNKLALAKQNDKVVMCSNCGGVSIGDPFDGVKAALKTFTVYNYGGSAWRWSYQYTFNYSRLDRTWQLVKVTEVTYHTSDPNKMKTKIWTPKQFGKVDIADFDPDDYVGKS